MTNREVLDNYSDEEMADYLVSVYIAGRLVEAGQAPAEPLTNILEWLRSPAEVIDD